MILKSFYRNKNTRIYIFLLIIIFIVMGSLFLIIGHLNNIADNLFVKNTIYYLQSNEDYYEYLSSYKDIVDIRRGMLWDFDNTFDENIVLNNALSEIATVYKKENNIMLTSDFQYIVNNSSLEDKIVIYPDSALNLSLRSNEIVININKETYKWCEIYKNALINKEIAFNVNGVKQVFIIKDFVSYEDRDSLIISDELFDKLNKDHLYIFNIRKEKMASEIESSMEELPNSNFIRQDYSFDNYSVKIIFLKNDIVKVKKIAVVTIGLFLLITIIFNVNILIDNKEKAILEKKMGFKNKQIKINIFKLLTSIHLLSIIVSIILLIIGSYVYGIIKDVVLPLEYIYFLFPIFAFIILSDCIVTILFNANNIS